MKRLALALCVVALSTACKKAEEAAPPADSVAVPAAPVDSMKADSMRADSAKMATDTTKPN
jgi:hypothetical protein